MKVLQTRKAVDAYLAEKRLAKAEIGFVPTMGALHRGHISLLEYALAENDIVVVSIFVNPSQFNNADDLAKYPRLPEQDLALLRKNGCHAVYMPDVADIYPEGLLVNDFDFGLLDKVMEGVHRPGHFAGVATVVKRFFEIVKPDRAYFGLKDFQQLAIVEAMVRQEKLAVKIVSCPTLREPDGLAMSSRNLRLSPQQRHAAPVIYESLMRLKSNVGSKKLQKARNMAIEEINAHPHLAVEYLDIVDADTLKPLENWEDATHAQVCTAVFAGTVRLIDNVNLY